MPEGRPSVMDVLCKAFDESGGETVDLFVEHEVLPEVKAEMMDWWIVNQEQGSRYHDWYPQDHVSCNFEAPMGSSNALCVVVESIGEFTASPLRAINRLKTKPARIPININMGTTAKP